MAISRAVPVWPLVAVCAAVRVAAAQQPPADSLHRDSLPAVLIGHVVDSTGAGLAGAEITLVKSDKFRIISGDSGVFRIAGLPAGTDVFNVRRIGYESASFTAVLKPGRTHRATLTLTASAQPLPAVAVADTATQTHWLDEFDRRRSGNRGTFITREQIVHSGARSGTDILRTVPGVRIVPMRRGMGNQVVMNRGSGARTCIPSMFVHGLPYSGTLDDFNADDIEALEVYVGVSEIPPEFDKIGRGVCGAIVIWTRDPNKKPPE